MEATVAGKNIWKAAIEGLHGAAGPLKRFLALLAGLERSTGSFVDGFSQS